MQKNNPVTVGSNIEFCTFSLHIVTFFVIREGMLQRFNAPVKIYQDSVVYKKECYNGRSKKILNMYSRVEPSKETLLHPTPPTNSRPKTQ